MHLTAEEFERVDIRVGTIREVAQPDGLQRPAYLLRIDFGADLGVLRSSAQLTRNHAPAELVGRQVAAVVNFAPRQIGKHMSECLVLGFPDSDGEPVLVQPSRFVPDGGRLW